MPFRHERKFPEQHRPSTVGSGFDDVTVDCSCGWSSGWVQGAPATKDREWRNHCLFMAEKGEDALLKDGLAMPEHSMETDQIVRCFVCGRAVKVVMRGGTKPMLTIHGEVDQFGDYCSNFDVSPDPESPPIFLSVNEDRWDAPLDAYIVCGSVLVLGDGSPVTCDLPLLHTGLCADNRGHEWAGASIVAAGRPDSCDVLSPGGTQVCGRNARHTGMHKDGSTEWNRVAGERVAT